MSVHVFVCGQHERHQWRRPLNLFLFFSAKCRVPNTYEHDACSLPAENIDMLCKCDFTGSVVKNPTRFRIRLPGLGERRIVRYLPFPTRLTVNTKARYILCRDKIDLADWPKVEGRGGRRENKGLFYCFHHIVSSSTLIHLHWYDSVYVLQLRFTKWPRQNSKSRFNTTVCIAL